MTTEIAQFISPVFFFYYSGVIFWSGVLSYQIILFVRCEALTKCNHISHVSHKEQDWPQPFYCHMFRHYFFLRRQVRLRIWSGDLHAHLRGSHTLLSASPLAWYSHCRYLWCECDYCLGHFKWTLRCRQRLDLHQIQVPLRHKAFPVSLSNPNNIFIDPYHRTFD